MSRKKNQENGVAAYVRRLHKDEQCAFTIGQMHAELSADVVKSYRLRPALARLAKALARQYVKRFVQRPESEVIGVKILTVGFRLELAEKDKEQ